LENEEGSCVKCEEDFAVLEYHISVSETGDSAYNQANNDSG
jgi:hypothetical protein